MLSLEKLIDRSSKLGSLPAIVYRVFEVMDRPDSSATEIGKVINDDPALTARLLKLVNSPFYGFSARVDTVYRAVALIGHKELRSVVVAASAIKVFDGIPSELVSMKDFWKRSLMTAVTARVLAAFKREREIERYFIAGLLHDIGSLLLYLQQPEEMTRVLEQQQSGVDATETERELFGYDHNQVSGELLKKWNLPPAIGQAVAFQGKPDKAPDDYQGGAWLLGLAVAIERTCLEVEADEEPSGKIDAGLWEANELEADILPTVLEKARQQFEDVQGILLDE